MILNNLKNMITQVLSGGEISLRPEEIAAKVGLDGGDLSDFMNALGELEKDGVVYSTRKGKYFMPDATGLVPAVVVSMMKKFSFARPKDGSEDIFVHNRNLNGALPGDTVFLKVRKNSRGTDGFVERVVARGSHEFSGKVVRAGKGLAVEADSSVRFPVALERSKKKQRVRPGEKVMVKIAGCGRNKGEYNAKLVKQYGDADCARVCADSIIDSAGIPYLFPDKVAAQAKSLSEAGITPVDYNNRLDLRKEVIFTIDGADAKDLDDAVSVERLPRGGWRLGVHIADVSHYVRSGTAMDVEAMQRGTSVYFADRVIPMLPKEISNGICSLNSGVDRLTFSAIIGLTAAGEIKSYRFAKTVICSKVRGVYSEVNSIFDGTAGEDILKKYSPVSDALTEMRSCARVLKNNSSSRGALAIDSKESKIILDENGVACAIEPRERGEAEELIEQFMITANVAAARFAEKSGAPFVYRIHEKPKEERLAALKETVQLFGLDLRLVHADSTPMELAKLLNQARGTKYARVVSEETLRTLSKARYAPECRGHFGLALTHYAHFTSPIRRYPDLSIHRILTDLVSGVSSDTLTKKYGTFAVKSSELSTDCEIRAMNAERDCEDCYKAEYMKAYVGDVFDGVISSVANHGIYVELPNSVEGMIRSDELYGCRFDGRMSYVTLSGKKKYSVGDPVRIQVTRVDISKGNIDFSIA